VAVPWGLRLLLCGTRYAASGAIRGCLAPEGKLSFDIGSRLNALGKQMRSVERVWRTAEVEDALDGPIGGKWSAREISLSSLVVMCCQIGSHQSDLVHRPSKQNFHQNPKATRVVQARARPARLSPGYLLPISD
jgi:hypothetical protein